MINEQHEVFTVCMNFEIKLLLQRYGNFVVIVLTIFYETWNKHIIISLDSVSSDHYFFTSSDTVWFLYFPNPLQTSMINLVIV